MIRPIVVMLLALSAAPIAAPAQTPESAGHPTRLRQESRPAQEGVLRAAIEERFMQRVATTLELDRKQEAQLRATNARYAIRRRELASRERALRLAMRSELQPGVAANQDSLGAALDQIAALQLERAKLQQDEMNDLSTFLTPVQRARYLVLQQQLKRIVEDAASRRAVQRRRSSQP